MTGSATWADFIDLDDGALFAQCEFDRFRASGPGGQKRNRTNSAVRLRHLPTGLQGEANESRSQHENRASALRRLRMTIALSARRPVDLATFAPSAELTRALAHPPGRRDLAKLQAIAELFDVLEVAGWQLSAAAGPLGATSAAIGRLLESDERVWRAAQERRSGLDLRPLHTANG